MFNMVHPCNGQTSLNAQQKKTAYTYNERLSRNDAHHLILNYEQMDIIRTELLCMNKHQTILNDVNFDMFNIVFFLFFIFELVLQHVLIDHNDVIIENSHFSFTYFIYFE